MALSLMSAVLILLVTITLLSQVEIKAASSSLDRLAAKENARLGMLVALDNLQRYAGPDQRVTARAEILGNGKLHEKNAMWTGVWDENGTFLTWLNSGQESVTLDPSESSDFVRVVGEGSSGQDESLHVWALLQKTDDYARSIARFAYHVSDESMKVSIGKQDRIEAILEEPSTANLTALEAKRLSQGTAGRPRSEILFAKLSKDLGENRTQNLWSDSTGDRSVAEKVNRAALAWNFDLIDDFYTDGDSGGRGRGASDPLSDLQSLYHDITYQSQGLLVDVSRGGLKLDLSDPNLDDSQSPFPLNDALKNFMAQRVNSEDRAVFQGTEYSVGRGQSSGSTFTVGEPINTTPLVMAEFALYIGVFRTGRYDDTLEVSLAVRADVWNPYATNLGFSRRGEDDFTISLEGLPTITVTWETGRGSSNSNSSSFDLDLSTLEFSKDDGGDTFTLAEVPYDIYDKMAVGEVRTVVERMTARIPSVVITDEGNRNMSSDDFVSLEAPSATLTVELSEIDSGRGQGGSGGATIQQLGNFKFEALDSQSVREYNLRSDSSPSYDTDYAAVYHFKFEDDLMLGDLTRWASEVDPRSINLDHTNTKVNQLIFVNEDPGFAPVANNKFMARPEFFFGGSGGRSRNYHRFFDYPARPLLSVGFLQHLAFYENPPFSIGNPWGGDKNAVFDRYFFSSYKSGPTSGGPANPHIESVIENTSIDPENGEVSAARFVVNGAFNLNSTSVEAWKSVLSGIHLHNWTYRIFEENTYGGGDIERPYVQNGIFRFPHHADRTFTHPYTDGIQNYPEITQKERENWYRSKWQPDWAAAFTTGMRELRGGYDNSGFYASDEDAIDDVSELAEAIVALLKIRNEPYTTIEELLTENVDDPSDAATLPLLQEAIDRTRINTVTEDNYKDAGGFLDRFPRYAASFLSQADVINVLAPFAQVRGDTFVIRAAGQNIDAIGNNGPLVYCEALVQRQINPVTGEGGAATAGPADPPGEFGRQFKIINLRWLTEEEI